MYVENCTFQNGGTYSINDPDNYYYRFVIKNNTVHGGSRLFGGYSYVNLFGALFEGNVVNDMTNAVGAAINFGGALPYDMYGSVDTLKIIIKDNTFTGVTDLDNQPNDAIYIGGRNMTTYEPHRYQRVYEVSNNVIQRGGSIRLDGNYEESDNTIIRCD